MKLLTAGRGSLVILATIAIALSWTDRAVAADSLQLTIPDVAPAPLRSITIQDMTALRRIDTLGLSPDGRRFAIFVRQADTAANDYRTGWFVGNAQGGALTPVGDGGQAGLRVSPNGLVAGVIESRDVRWSPDGQWLAYTLRRDGEVQLWRSRQDGGLQQQLTHNAADVRGFEWSDDGSALYFTVGTARNELRQRERAKQRDGYSYDEDLSYYDDFLLPQFIRPLETDLSVWTVSLGDGLEQLGGQEQRVAFERAQKISAGGRENILSAVANAVIPPVARADGAQAWLVRLAPSSLPLKVVASLAKDAAPISCAAPECSGTIKKIWWSADGKRVMIWRGEGIADASDAFYAWTPGRRVVQTILRVRDDHFDNCNPAADDLLLCVRDTPTRPVHVASIDLRTGKVRTVAEVNPEFSNIRLGKAERLEWDTPKFQWNEPGGKLAGVYPARAFGYILYPPDFDPSKKYPVFIEPYAAFGFDVPTLHSEQPLHVYAANGFIVLNTQFPVPVDPLRLGATGMQQLYSSELDFPHMTMLMESTVRALELAAARGFIDRSRVGIGGISHGSFVPMYMLQKHDLIAAISISSPGWGPLEYYVSTKAGRQSAAAMGGADWPPSPESAAGKELKRLDLAEHIDSIEAPILMNLSAREAYGALRLIRNLADADRPYDAYIFPNETHIKWQPEHLHAIMNRNLDWFRFWLQDYEDPAPEKAKQYRRWQKLREQQAAHQRASGTAAAR